MTKPRKGFRRNNRSEQLQRISNELFGDLLLHRVTKDHDIVGTFDIITYSDEVLTTRAVVMPND